MLKEQLDLSPISPPTFFYPAVAVVVVETVRQRFFFISVSIVYVNVIVLTFWSPYGRLLHKTARLCTFARSHTYTLLFW